MVATTNDVGTPDTGDAANVATDIQNRTRWAWILAALGKTAIFDRNHGDGTEAATRTLAFTGMGMIGWDGEFLASDVDYPNTFVLTQEGATARKIKATMTWSAESPTATVDDIVYAYDDAGGGGYTNISELSGTIDANDLTGDAVGFHYDRPRQTNVIESVATTDLDDMRAIRDNNLSLLCASFYRGHLHTQYVGIPGATPVVTPAASLTPTRIAFTINLVTFRYDFTYYSASVFPDGVTRPKRVTMSIRRKTGVGDGIHAVSTHEYIYKSNGMLFMSRAV